MLERKKKDTLPEATIRKRHKTPHKCTGTSGCIPNIYCLTAPEPSCKVCLSTQKTISGELWSECKNKRRNTSILIRYLNSFNGKICNVVVDCGKTFYESALQWFVKYNFREISGCILTHGHADAMFGLDDLRQWTIGGPERAIQSHVDVYLSKQTFEAVQTTFPYLVDRSQATGGGDIPSLKYHVFDQDAPFFNVHGQLKVIPLLVNHGFYSDGSPFKSNGFRFGNVAYISDVSFIPHTTLERLHGCDTLILDGLGSRPHISHFSIGQAVLVALLHQPAISPRLLLLTDFCHVVDHDALESELEQFSKYLATENDLVQRTHRPWSGSLVKFGVSDAESLSHVLNRPGKLHIPKMRPSWDGMRVAFDYPELEEGLLELQCQVSKIEAQDSSLPDILISESM